MIVVDENSDHFKKMTTIKWRQTLPQISEEQAIYCEKQLIAFANKEKTEQEALAEINKYLTELKLIKLNGSISDTSTEQNT
jgi:hypothetical protein